MIHYHEGEGECIYLDVGNLTAYFHHYSTWACGIRDPPTTVHKEGMAIFPYVSLGTRSSYI